MAGVVPTEMKASFTEGAEPETGKLYEALLGGKRVLTSTITDVGHTASSIVLQAADSGKYKVGDIIKVKESANGKVDHISPIQSINPDTLVNGPLVIDGTNDQVRYYDSSMAGNWATSVPQGNYNTIQEIIDALETAVNDAGNTSTGKPFTVTYDTNTNIFRLTNNIGNNNPRFITGSTFTSAIGFEADFAYTDQPTYIDAIAPFTFPVVGTLESIELLIPYSEPFTDSVEIAAATIYYHESGAPTLSVTNYLGGEIREKAIGMRPVSAELSNFSTGQLPEVAFSLEGLDFDREVGQPLFTPEYDSQQGAEAPIILCSKIYKDTTELTLNALTISFTNTLGFLTSTSSCSGKLASRITKFGVGFTINPYMEDDDVDLFTLFNDNDGFSLFGSAYNDGASPNEHLQACAFYMPNCRIPEITTGDEDGILTDQINGTAHRDLGNDTIFIAFI
jgi:hypothetical protein